MSTILRLTWKELLRKRVMMLTLIMTVLFLIAFWFIAKTIGSDLHRPGVDKTSMDYFMRKYETGSIILTLGFFFGSFVIAFLSIFSSFAVIAGEAEQAVMQALLPRPLPRSHWYAGRWIGYVSFGVLYALALFIAIFLIAFIHAGVPGYFAIWVKSFLLFAFIVPMLVSLSMLGSSLFSAVGNGVLMTMLFGAGWLGGMIEKVSQFLPLQNGTTKPLSTIAGLMSIIMPSDAVQRRMLAELLSVADIGLPDMNRLLGPLGFYPVPSNAFLIYACCYTIAVAAIGMRLFGRKDL